MLSGCCEPLLPPAARMLAAGVIRWGIAAVWLYAAASKARNQGALRSMIGKLMPARLSDAVPLTAHALIASELLLGLALLAGWHKHVAAALSAGLFGMFAVVLVILEFRTAMPQGGCGCFGRVAPLAQDASIDATAPAIARNLVMVALAVVVATQP